MNIWLLTDGLAENISKKRTSLQITKHPNLDRLTKEGNLVLYEPVTRPGMPNPETNVVYPYFFGLKPEHNPGRAGLELYGFGVDITKYSHVAVFRIIPNKYNVRDGWDAAPRFIKDKEICVLVKNVAQEFSDRVVTKKSTVSYKGNVWCIGALDKDAFEDFLCILQYEVSRLSMNLYPVLFETYNSQNTYANNRFSNNQQWSKLYGWSIGSLPEAMKLAGITISEHDSMRIKLFEYEKKIADCKQRIIPMIKEKIDDKHHNAIIFVKEPSVAARKLSRNDKLLSIEFIDELVGIIFDNFEGTQTKLLVISDHQSNIGIEKTFPGPTIACCASLSNLVLKGNFSEVEAYNQNNNIMSQKEAIEWINSLIFNY